MNSLVYQLRRLALRANGRSVSDAQLLRRFLDDQDQVAFELLVHRHGAMVLGTCRRVLVNEHDAEDAFQATFLVLARKASSLANPDLLGPWLYGVAFRTACKARSGVARRQRKDAEARPFLVRDAADERLDSDLRPIIDEELHRLPEKYRTAVILCDLESRSRGETASLLGIPEGTLSSRLAHARVLLAKRLTRRGLATALPCAAIAILAEHASATVPPALIQSVVHSAPLAVSGMLSASGASIQAIVLAKKVLQGMSLVKLVTLGVTCGLLMVGVMGSTWLSRATTNETTGVRTSIQRADDSPTRIPVKQPSTIEARAEEPGPKDEAPSSMPVDAPVEDMQPFSEPPALESAPPPPPRPPRASTQGSKYVDQRSKGKGER